MTITFTNAVVEDDGYGVEVNGRSLEAIISTVLCYYGVEYGL